MEPTQLQRSEKRLDKVHRVKSATVHIEERESTLTEHEWTVTAECTGELEVNEESKFRNY
jgi:hypothetical protein